MNDWLRSLGWGGEMGAGLIEIILDLITDPTFVFSVLYSAVGKGSASSIKAGSGAADDVAKSAVDDVAKAGDDVGSNIKFGSDTKSAGKLSSQMAQRGWTENTVRDIIKNPYTTRISTNMATGNSATVYYNKAGGYVIIDDVTKEVVQVSDNINPSSWIPDSNIVNPYIPE